MKRGSFGNVMYNEGVTEKCVLFVWLTSIFFFLIFNGKRNKLINSFLCYSNSIIENIVMSKISDRISRKSITTSTRKIIAEKLNKKLFYKKCLDLCSKSI